MGPALPEAAGIPDGQGPGRHSCGARSLCWAGAAGGPQCSEAALGGGGRAPGPSWLHVAGAHPQGWVREPSSCQRSEVFGTDLLGLGPGILCASWRLQASPTLIL